MKKIFPIILLIISLASCDERKPYLTYADQEMVIEGWIDNGGFPYVFLSKTVLADGKPTSMEDIDKYTVRHAEVTLNDGTRDYKLIGLEIDELLERLREMNLETGFDIPFTKIEDIVLLPPFVYTSFEVMGQVGKTYTVTAKSEDYEIVGSSTIQEPVEISEVRTEKVTDDPNDDRYKAVVCFKDNPDTHDYYKAFVMLDGKKPMFMPSLLANLDDATLYKDTDDVEAASNVELSIYQDFTIPISDFRPYFHKGETVYIKLVKINEREFKYWDVLEELTIFSRNMFFPTTTRIQPTVRGGEGYWCAYGSSYVKVTF
ncbi:MAG: DUF4249 family protein [Bacteroidales bacterium]|nr:DUF4249 family protein [Candidatus Cryptobacteroides caccocaballi]